MSKETGQKRTRPAEREVLHHLLGALLAITVCVLAFSVVAQIADWGVREGSAEVIAVAFALLAVIVALRLTEIARLERMEAWDEVATLRATISSLKMQLVERRERVSGDVEVRITGDLGTIERGAAQYLVAAAAAARKQRAAEDAAWRKAAEGEEPPA